MHSLWRHWLPWKYKMSRMQGNWLYNDQETNWWKTKEKSKDNKFYPNIKSRYMEGLFLMARECAYCGRKLGMMEPMLTCAKCNKELSILRTEHAYTNGKDEK